MVLFLTRSSGCGKDSNSSGLHDPLAFFILECFLSYYPTAGDTSRAVVSTLGLNGLLRMGHWSRLWRHVGVWSGYKRVWETQHRPSLVDSQHTSFKPPKSLGRVRIGVETSSFTAHPPTAGPSSCRPTLCWKVGCVPEASEG